MRRDQDAWVAVLERRKSGKLLTAGTYIDSLECDFFLVVEGRGGMDGMAEIELFHRERLNYL